MAADAPGQINISIADITSAEAGAKKIGVLDLMMGFSLIEDINSPFLTCTIELGDAYGFIAKHNIRGCGDKLELSFKNPDGSEITVELYSYAMGDRFDLDYRMELYTIHFTSEGAFKNEYKRISKYYKKKTTDIIKEIVEEELELEITLDVNSDEEIELIIPNWKPIQAINWLMARTIPSEPSPWDTSLVFYEDIEGEHHLTSIGKLNEGSSIHDTPEEGWIHGRPNMKGVEDLGDEKLLKYASQMTVVYFDNLNQIREGCDYNSTLTHDITRKFFQVTEYKAKDMFDKANRLLDERWRKYAEDGDNPYSNIYDEQPTVHRYYPKSQFLFNLEEDKSGQDKVGKDDAAEDKYDWLANRVHQDWSKRSMRCEMTVPGTSEIKAGDIVSIAKDTAEAGGEGNEEADRKIEDDKFAYGDYLITAIKHRYFSMGNSAYGSNYHIVVDMLRDSVEG